jgi:hypothetical protein
MAISVNMGFPLIDRAATEIGRMFEGKYSDQTGLFPRVRRSFIWLKSIQKAQFTGINFLLQRSSCDA